MERKKLELIMSVLMILCAFALAERGWQQTLGEHVTGNSGKKCVVIDAGHGGNDPGKIGVDDSREKDLNLVIADKVKRILEQQDIDVIMTGNYTPPSFFEQHINWINDEYAAFYRGIIEELLEKTDQTVEEAALRHCEREMGEVAPDDFRLVMHKMIFIDLYVRNYWRGMVIKTLAEAGITVDVIGKGWELECSAMQNVRIHPQTDSLTCLEQLSHAKISVNVMPWFKDGAHDRVFNSILNGAVCVSDTSRYLSEELKEGEGVSYYDLKHLEQLPVKVKDLLADEKQMRDIAMRGVEKTAEKHTWAQRAIELEEKIRVY